jgi:hypothetical protein
LHGATADGVAINERHGKVGQFIKKLSTFEKSLIYLNKIFKINFIFRLKNDFFRLHEDLSLDDLVLVVSTKLLVSDTPVPVANVELINEKAWLPPV